MKRKRELQKAEFEMMEKSLQNEIDYENYKNSLQNEYLRNLQNKERNRLYKIY